ncbi:MAG: insulinase family protein [Oscillospiraceae bacterium]|nr:insulinase family protein [Oscillospiraceae bacterium]
MSLERINIGKEININFIESDKFKTNFIEINIISRLESELKASKNALLVKVLKRGSANFPTMADINKRQNELYAAKIGVWADKIGEAQILIFSAEMLENKYSLDDINIADETIDLLGDIFINPLIEDNKFKNDYVEGEKTNLIDDIHAQINNKNAYVYRKCIETMCKNERFAINNLGSVECVQKINNKNLYEHYEYILSSCVIEIFCVGKFSEKKQSITEKFKNLLKNIKRENIEIYDTDVILKSDYKGETIEEIEVNQGKLAIGFRMGTSNKNKDFAKFVLFDAVYALTPTGKLFMNVREKLSLCYYCRTIVESAKGIITVLCGIENENKQKATDEILRLLEEMKNGDFTDKDIESAQLSVINSYKEVFDNAGSIVYWYLRRLMSGNIKSPEDMIEEIKKVTRGDIIESAKNLSLDTIYFLQGNLLNSEESGEN